MPNFVDCWNSLKAKGYKHADGSEVLNNQDRASIEARIQEHLRTGLDPIEAAKASVKSHLDEAHAQLQSIYDQVAPKQAQAQQPTKVVDQNGNPMRVYHGTRNVFQEFEPSAVSTGIHFSESPDIASAYAENFGIPKETGSPNVHAAYLDIKNPAPPEVVNEVKTNFPQSEVKSELIRRGYDGIQYELNGKKAFVAFHANQVIPAFSEAGIRITKGEPVSEAGQAPAVAGQPKIEGGVSEEVQKGQEGREAVLATERVQPPAVPPESPEALGEALKERPRSAGVANRVLQERAARGEIPQAPEAGEGHLTEDIINKSRQDYTPERAMAAAENIKNGSTNEADAGQIRIHEENLTRVARDAEKALDADPKNPVLQQAYNAAKDNLSKWHNETVQPMKTQWSNIGKSMQGATDIDTGSYIGLQKLAWDTAKRDFTPQEEPVMRAAAKRSDQATKEVQAAIARAEDHVQKVLKPSRYMDLNQLRESLAEKLKNITC